MTDIVWRLRLVDPNQVLLAAPPFDTSYLPVGLLCHEAANEIERLRAENLRAFDSGYDKGVQDTLLDYGVEP